MALAHTIIMDHAGADAPHAEDLTVAADQEAPAAVGSMEDAPEVEAQVVAVAVRVDPVAEVVMEAAVATVVAVGVRICSG